LCLGAAACGGDDDGADGSGRAVAASLSTSTSAADSTTSSSASSTSTTSEPATPEEEVEAAYLRSWDVYAEAVRELDPSGLEEAYAGDALGLLTDEVDRLKSAGTPVDIDVTHDYLITFTDDTTAVVFDTYLSNSVLLDPDTEERTERGPPDAVKKAYQLEKAGERWKVVFIRTLQ
jgi:hypothetical protein